MLEYNRIDVSEEIDVHKTNGLCECIICYYWYFLKINFKCQHEACNSCHDLMKELWVLIMLSMLLLKEMIIEFFFCIWVRWSHIRKVDLTEKSGILLNIKVYYHIYKMGKEIIRFGDVTIEKQNPSFLEDVDLGDVLMSNKISFDEKKLEILYWLLAWWL